MLVRSRELELRLNALASPTICLDVGVLTKPAHMAGLFRPVRPSS